MLSNVVIVAKLMYKAAYVFLMPFRIRIRIRIILKGYKGRVISSSGRGCLLYMVVLLKFLNEINNRWGVFALLFFSNKVYS